MKNITIQIKGLPSDISLLTKEANLFEKKLRSLFNEVSILIVLDIMNLSQEKQTKTKVGKKNKKKELFYSNDLSNEINSKNEKYAN